MSGRRFLGFFVIQWYVHNSFYASGFLYHPSSGQILLRKHSLENDQYLSFFRVKSEEVCDPKKLFQTWVEKTLQVRIPLDIIHPVYDYVHAVQGQNYLFCALVTGECADYQKTKDSQWIPLSKFTKYSMDLQTKHDIIIGERVIRLLSNPQESSSKRGRRVNRQE